MAKYDATTIYSEYTSKVESRIIEIESWVADGLTFGEIAKELHIDNSLLWAMRQNKSFVDLRRAFKIKTAYIDNVEMALYRKAVGHFVEEEQAFKVKRTYTDKKGKKATQEVIQKVKVKKYIEPDINAIKFLLINKNGEEYHAETQKPVDTSIETIVDHTRDILVSIKTKASEMNESNEDNTDGD